MATLSDAVAMAIKAHVRQIDKVGLSAEGDYTPIFKL